MRFKRSRQVPRRLARVIVSAVVLVMIVTGALVGMVSRHNLVPNMSDAGGPRNAVAAPVRNITVAAGDPKPIPPGQSRAITRTSAGAASHQPSVNNLNIGSPAMANIPNEPLMNSLLAPSPVEDPTPAPTPTPTTTTYLPPPPCAGLPCNDVETQGMINELNSAFGLVPSNNPGVCAQHFNSQMMNFASFYHHDIATLHGSALKSALANIIRFEGNAQDELLRCEHRPKPLLPVPPPG